MTSNSNNKILGVLLCGGKSSRMGSDKGLLSRNQERWFERSYRLLSQIFSNVVISINAKQSFSYKEIRPDLEYIPDSIKFAQGPLVGILTVHEKYPEYDLFVLACDMIEMELDIIQDLITSYESNPNYDFYLYQNEIYLETLCGIYTSKGLQKIIPIISSENNPNFAIHRLISTFDLLTHSVDSKIKKAFTNFNTPEELKIQA